MASIPTLVYSLADEAGLDAIVAQFYQTGIVVVQQAIPLDLCDALVADLKSRDNFTPAGVGRGEHSALNSDIRRDKTCWLDGSSTAQQQYMALLDTLQHHVNRRCFLGLTHYECHYAHYQVGDFYQKHLDAFVGRSNRRLTTVCYLNDSPAGGTLRVYDDHDQFLVDVQPAKGLLVMFESERFPHEVLPANQDRYSIAGWFRIDSAVL